MGFEEEMVAKIFEDSKPMSSPEEDLKLKIFSYWSSSASHRVRIALNLKGLEYDYIAVNLSKNEQSSPEFEKVNPTKCVPALVDGDFAAEDSFSIILFDIDSIWRTSTLNEHPLLPQDLQKRALNIQIASIVGSSIHPLLNLRALMSKHYKAVSLSIDKSLGQSINPDEKMAFAQSSIVQGFTAIENLLKSSSWRYATGDKVQLADVFLAPQILKATKRFQIDMSPFPTLVRLNEVYSELPALQSALPEKQPDAHISS